MIVAAFAPDERPKAIGTWTAFSGIAAVVGPLVGGWLVDSLGWRWIFVIGLPFIAVALLLAARMPAAAPARAGRRPDWLGAGLCALGLAGPTLGLVRQPGHGWSDALVAGPLVAGAVLFGLFLLWERHGARDPMLPLGRFRRSNFAWGNLETLFVYGALGLLFFVLVVFLQQVAGYSALEAGAATIPTTVVLFLLARRFGALADRLGRGGSWPSARSCRPAVSCTYSRLLTSPRPPRRHPPRDDDLRAWPRHAGLATLVSPLTAAVGALAGGMLDLGGLQTALAGTAGLLVLGGITGLLAIRDPRRAPVAMPARAPAG